MTGLVDVLASCMRKPTRIVISCDPIYGGGRVWWLSHSEEPVYLEIELKVTFVIKSF